MGVSDKYGKVTVEIVRSDPIAADEPVVVFRAKDDLAVAALLHYKRICEECEASEEHLEGIQRQIDAFVGWQYKNGTRMPGVQ